MGFNANVGSQSFSDKQVLDQTHPPLVVAEDIKADQGELAAGLIVAKDANKKIVPYNKVISQIIGAGDGEAVAFSGTLTGRKACPGSVSVASGAQELIDDEYGRLAGDGTGTVNYETGEIAVEFAAPPVNAANITVTYANKPTGVLTIKVDTTKETVGPVLIHGTVVKAGLLVGEDAPDATDLKRLEEILIVAI